jgi:hypothetical protein
VKPLLEWIGARARWVLPAGCLCAVLFPASGAALRPFLPGLVALVIGLALARIAIVRAARDIVRPHRLLLILGLLAVMMPGLALVMAGLGAVLPPALALVLVVFALAPPVGSASAFAFFLGLDARLALELMLAGTLATPLLGPLVLGALGLATLAPLDLAARLALTVGGGLALGLAIRVLWGPARIARSARAFDGIAAIALALFFLPLFDGFAELATADPARTALAAGLAFALNFGFQILGRRAAGLVLPPDAAGAVGLVAGNRNVALYLAALPFDPFFALFTAFYQVPMSLSPFLYPGRGRAAARDGAG